MADVDLADFSGDRFGVARSVFADSDGFNSGAVRLFVRALQPVNWIAANAKNPIIIFCRMGVLMVGELRHKRSWFKGVS